MFSESFHATIEDIHFIVGPNIENLAKSSEYMSENDLQSGAYDQDDYLKNQQWKFGQVAELDKVLRQKQIYEQEQRREELERMTEK